MPYKDKAKQLACAREWKQKKRAENIAKGLNSDGTLRKPKKRLQTKEEKYAYLLEWKRKKREENLAAGLTSEGLPRKRKVLTPEERKENKKRLHKKTYEKRKHIYLAREKAKRSANKDAYNARHKELKEKRLLDPEKREAHNAMHRLYRKNRMKKDPEFKLICNMRTLMYIAISGRGYRQNKNHKKSKSTMRYIGCTIKELRCHLESLFTDGMTWENYGSWHVDHIVPVSQFDHSKENSIHECWHYTNLQPLWAEDNLSKGDKY